MKNSLTARLSTRYHQALAGLLDGLVLRSHDRIAHRRQHAITPRLPEPANFDHHHIENLFPAPPPIPLAHLRGDVWERQGRLWRRDFAFPSSVLTAHEHNRRVIVQTYANDRALHFPAVIVLHGLLTPTLIAYRPFFRAIVETGASAYALELPYHLRRTPPDWVSGELFFTPDLEISLASIRQAVADVRQLTHYLREAGAPIIGVLGFSLGAWISAIVASCEPEVDFALFALPPSHLNDLVWHRPLGGPLRRRFESAGWSATTTAPFYDALDPLNLALPIPPERCELFAAEYDRFIPIQHTLHLQQAWHQSRLRVYSSGHIGLLWSRKFLRDFQQILAQQLALGRREEKAVTVVTEAALQALPQNTHDSALHNSIVELESPLEVKK